ncbi:DUF397 domain-containing protein [Streptomyces sp. NPDC051546]|uniref:DUF397 domain-containing protein n=1 Tax=Streptomyces sp. NPDC051546 TaxID=3365655 RepID=UPI003797AF98
MTTIDLPRWIKSSYSGDNGGNCIEVAVSLAGSLGIVPVRDSKLSNSPIIDVPAAAFGAFVTAVKADELGAL